MKNEEMIIEKRKQIIADIVIAKENVKHAKEIERDGLKAAMLQQDVIILEIKKSLINWVLNYAN